MCVCACLCLFPTLSEHLEVSWSLGILEKEPLREVNIHVTGRHQEDPIRRFTVQMAYLQAALCHHSSLIPMISSLSRYEFWKTDIPALPPYAARAASRAELLITLLFCTPISLTEKNNRTAFPDKPCLRELILGATPTQELGRGWRCVGIRQPLNSFLMVRFSHPSTSVVAVN